MTLEDYRFLFFAATLVLALVAASPALSLVVPFGNGLEPLSEIWLLGPSHMLEDLPSEIRANSSYGIFVGVDNQMGAMSYYRIDVKLRNSTQPLPDKLTGEPSPLRPLHEFWFFVADGDTWEVPMSFAFHNLSFQNDVAFVGSITIENVTLLVERPSVWDSEKKGFFYELFFELYLYDLRSQGFQFHNRYAKLQLNATNFR